MGNNNRSGRLGIKSRLVRGKLCESLTKLLRTVFARSHMRQFPLTCHCRKRRFAQCTIGVSFAQCAKQRHNPRDALQCSGQSHMCLCLRVQHERRLARGTSSQLQQSSAGSSFLRRSPKSALRLPLSSEAVEIQQFAKVLHRYCFSCR